ncbi:MAG: hypothetical protein AAF512_18730 [Pseudomonadota bacterium]
MAIEIQTHAEKTERGWRDQDGFVGPVRPGNGPRTDPRGDFPTGPEVGTELPNFQCLDTEAKPFDFYAHKGDKPAVLVFFRSAVW